MMSINFCLFFLAALFNYILIFTIAVFVTDGFPDEVLLKEYWYLIFILVYIISIFMGCPLSFMLEQQVNKNEVKEFMALLDQQQLATPPNPAPEPTSHYDDPHTTTTTDLQREDQVT